LFNKVNLYTNKVSLHISNDSLAFSLVPVKGALLKKSLEFFASKFLKLASEKEYGEIEQSRNFFKFWLMRVFHVARMHTL